MRGAILHAPGDIRVEDRDDPRIEKPTDAVIRMSATCVCGSDLWSYRGVNESHGPAPMGHEYVGIVEEVGSDVTTIRPGQFVIGSFFASDGTCPNCRNGFQTACLHAEPMGALGAQAEALRVPWADGTLVATPEVPDDDLLPSLLAASDVLGTGWFAAVQAGVGPGSTVAVVGDGAVGLLGVLAAKELGAERIIAMSRHESRQRLATEFGATDIVAERGDEGVERVKDLTNGIGADAVLECVGTSESMSPGHELHPPRRPRRHRRRAARRLARRDRAVLLARPDRRRTRAGPPLPARPVERIVDRRIDPGKVFDLTLPLGAGGRGVCGDGRAPGHQVAPPPLTSP